MIAQIFKCGILTNSLSFNSAFTEAIFYEPPKYPTLPGPHVGIKDVQQWWNVLLIVCRLFFWSVFKDSVNTCLLELQGEFVQTTVSTKCWQRNFSTSQATSKLFSFVYRPAVVVQSCKKLWEDGKKKSVQLPQIQVWSPLMKEAATKCVSSFL